MLPSPRRPWSPARSSFPLRRLPFPLHLPCPLSSKVLALLGDFQHLGNLLFVLTAEPESMRALRAVGDGRLQPALVLFRLLLPLQPLTGVVGELRLVHHGDAIGNGTDCLANSAATAGLHVGVVETVRGDVEARVRALQPTERAFDAGE